MPGASGATFMSQQQQQLTLDDWLSQAELAPFGAQESGAHQQQPQQQQQRLSLDERLSRVEQRVSGSGNGIQFPASSRPPRWEAPRVSHDGWRDSWD